MGANLARNIASREQQISVFNRTTEKTDEFIKDFGNDYLIGAHTIEEFISSLETPRKIIIMVKAGDPVDQVVAQIKPFLKNGDIIIDGGNSHYKDTEKRQAESSKVGLHFIGMGISGGEEGALHGPSMMPGGEKSAYDRVATLLDSAAADDGLGGKCLSYIGQASSGHFVKMVHNGIEYGIMQLIAEAYDILKNIGGLSNSELAKTFEQYNQSKNSFLLEITAKIFKQKDPASNKDLIDLIKDAGKQKGTGKWTSEAAYELGVSTPTIHAAVDARIMSGSLDLRHRKLPSRPLEKQTPEELKLLVEDALDLASLCTYFQGFELMKAASSEYKWSLNFAEIARIWRGGCIIRSSYLNLLQDSYATDEESIDRAGLAFMQLFDSEKQSNWRKAISLAIDNAAPTPTLSASLNYYDSIQREHLPQNLTQAQRDFFGAHGYERIDQEGNFHTEW